MARPAARRRTALAGASPWRRPRSSRPLSRQWRRLSCSRGSRVGSRSSAVTSAPAAASCAVLPPGAAHRSAMRSPGCGAEQAHGEGRGGVLHPEWPPAQSRAAARQRCRRETAPSRSAAPRHPPAAAHRAEASGRAAPRADAPPRSCAHSAPQEVQNHAGVSSRGLSSSASAAGPASATRRSTAFTRPANGVQAMAARQGDGGGDRGVPRGVQQQQASGAEAHHVAHRFGRRLLQERLQHGVQRANAAQVAARDGAPPSGRAGRRAAAHPAPPPAAGGDPAPRSADRTRRRGWGRTWWPNGGHSIGGDGSGMVVELRGIEPLTSSLRTRRSPN